MNFHCTWRQTPIYTNRSQFDHERLHLVDDILAPGDTAPLAEDVVVSSDADRVAAIAALYAPSPLSPSTDHGGDASLPLLHQEWWLHSPDAVTLPTAAGWRRPYLRQSQWAGSSAVATPGGAAAPAGANPVPSASMATLKDSSSPADRSTTVAHAPTRDQPEQQRRWPVQRPSPRDPGSAAGFHGCCCCCCIVCFAAGFPGCRRCCIVVVAAGFRLTHAPIAVPGIKNVVPRESLLAWRIADLMSMTMMIVSRCSTACGRPPSPENSRWCGRKHCVCLLLISLCAGNAADAMMWLHDGVWKGVMLNRIGGLTAPACVSNPPPCVGLDPVLVPFGRGISFRALPFACSPGAETPWG